MASAIDRPKPHIERGEASGQARPPPRLRCVYETRCASTHELESLVAHLICIRLIPERMGAGRFRGVRNV